MKIKVGTFYTPREGRPPVKSRVQCYTRSYNAAWRGCIEYEIEAESGAQAKKIAALWRVNHETYLADKRKEEAAR